METKAIIMDEKAMDRAITRIANEIIERNKGVKGVILTGIKTRGIPFAQRLRRRIEEIEGKKIGFFTLDITLYRDDLSEKEKRSICRVWECKYKIDEKIIVLVDDVMFTGRTIRAALDALVDIGRPKKVQLAVLIDRGHRELPIRADYVGKNLPTSRDEIVDVYFSEIDGLDRVVIKSKE